MLILRLIFQSIDENMFNWFKQELPHIKHNILSAIPYVTINQTLEALGLELELFMHKFAQDFIDGEIPNPYFKPSEELCRCIVTFLDTEPSKILAIGNSEKSDIKPAKAVGMKTVMVYGKSELADVSLLDVYQVPKIFRI